MGPELLLRLSWTGASFKAVMGQGLCVRTDIHGLTQYGALFGTYSSTGTTNKRGLICYDLHGLSVNDVASWLRG